MSARRRVVGLHPEHLLVPACGFREREPGCRVVAGPLRPRGGAGRELGTQLGRLAEVTRQVDAAPRACDIRPFDYLTRAPVERHAPIGGDGRVDRVAREHVREEKQL